MHKLTFMRYCFFVFGFVIFLFSCTKNTSNNSTAPAYTNALKSITYSDSVILLTGNVNDTIITLYTDSFGYDAQQRLAKHYHTVITYDYPNISTPVSTIASSKIFSYNGNSPSPVGYSENGINHVLAYDAQNRLVADSISNPGTSIEATRNTFITYGANTVTQKDYAKYNGQPHNNTTTLTVQNDNIVASTLTSSLGPGLTYSYTYTYGNVDNPLNTLNFNHTVDFPSPSVTFDKAPRRIHSKNILTSQTYSGTNVSTAANTVNAAGKLVKLNLENRNYLITYN